MRKGRRERIEKGSRERIAREKRKKIDFFLDPAMRCSHCFFKSSGYDKLELKHQIVVFISLQNALLKKCHGVKQNENKTLGRARDPRANGAWLNKLTE